MGHHRCTEVLSGDQQALRKFSVDANLSRSLAGDAEFPLIEGKSMSTAAAKVSGNDVKSASEQMDTSQYQKRDGIASKIFGSGSNKQQMNFNAAHSARASHQIL